MLENHGTYGGTLLDPRWKTKRQEILKRDNYKCVNCGSEAYLQVHHKQYHFSKSLNEYRNPWEYSGKYLITLCEKCHKKGHNYYRVPIKMVS
ncbi:MAG: HNH endonuclease [Bacteroidales bacterium]|nr:HNH endonuclease [Bacteroidales bacterium]